jgi:hypothetical protein
MGWDALKINGIWVSNFDQIPDRVPLFVSDVRIDDVETPYKGEFCLIKNDKPSPTDTAVVCCLDRELVDIFCGGVVRLRFCDFLQFQEIAYTVFCDELNFNTTK